MVLVGLLCSSVSTGSQVLHGDFYFLPIPAACDCLLWDICESSLQYSHRGQQTDICHILMNTSMKLCTFPVHLFYDIHNFPESLLDALVYHNPVCLNSRISITDDLIFIHEPGCACGLNGLFSH